MENDLGVSEKRLRIKIGASVALSVASRRGLGGLRHVEVINDGCKKRLATEQSR